MRTFRALLVLPALAMSLAAATPTAPGSVFAKKSALPFQAPDFSKIKDADFLPAFDQAMKIHAAEMRKIADNPAPATFKNTIVAMERAGQMLTRVQMAFNALSSANTDDTLQKTQEAIAPKLAAHYDAINLDTKLFARVEAIYAKRDKLGLNAEAKRLVEVDYQGFVKAGAKLSDADKASLKKLNEEESTLEAQFNTKLLAAPRMAPSSSATRLSSPGFRMLKSPPPPRPPKTVTSMASG